jgi:hypothetical protein
LLEVLDPKLVKMQFRLSAEQDGQPTQQARL